MKLFQFSTIFAKNSRKEKLSSLKSIGNKRIWSVVFLLVALFFFSYDYWSKFSDANLSENTLTMETYGNQLQSNITSIAPDTTILQLERQQLLQHIEKRLVTYLYQIPDYTYMKTLEPYLRYAPKILEQIPSAVPLEKGEYTFTGKYGIRKHPISGKEKKHFGIDLAAAADKYVYASATGTVLSINHDKKGYGTHIIIKHRFGFSTLYGHLNKTVVHIGQKIEQHQIIGTVGTTGSSTGYHLHYEIMKNTVKVDPFYSLNLKHRIYSTLFKKQLKYGTMEKY